MLMAAPMRHGVAVSRAMVVLSMQRVMASLNIGVCPFVYFWSFCG